MSTFEKKTLFVTEPLIDLGGGVFLPNGTYPVEVEYLPLNLRGQECWELGRVLVYFTRKALEDLGFDLSGNSASELSFDVSRFVGMFGVRIG